MAFANADTINRFNMSNTNARNQTRQANTGLLNLAKSRNLETRQGLANNNTNLGMQKLGRSDSNAMSGFGAQMTKYGAIDDVLNSQLQQVTREDERKRKDRQEAYGVVKDAAQAAGGFMGGL
jgi:hypothetical protein